MADSGTTVDTSIYKNSVSENPLDVASKAADYRNKLLGNIQGQQAIEQGDQQIQANQIKLATERFKMVNDAAAGVLSDPDLGKADVTPKLWSVLGRLTAGDAMSAAHAVQFMQDFPRDPERQRQAIQAVHAQTLGAWEKGKAYIGELQGVGTGGGTKFVRAPAFGGAPTDQGYLPNTLPPTERVPQGDPNLPNYGAKSFVGGAGNPGIQPPPGFPESPLAARPQVAPSLPARRMAPQTPQPQPIPQQRPAPAAPVAQAPIMSDLPGGSETAFKGAADALVAARDSAATYGQRINPLRQALPIISGMSETDIGPTSEKWNQIKSTIQTLGGGKLVGIDPEKIANYNEAKKYLNQYNLPGRCRSWPAHERGTCCCRDQQSERQHGQDVLG